MYKTLIVTIVDFSLTSATSRVTCIGTGWIHFGVEIENFSPDRIQ